MATLQHLKKQVLVRRFRVKVGAIYCLLDTKLHELGVVIPSTTVREHAHVFKSTQGAQNAIDRLEEARKRVKASLYPNWGPLKVVNFEGTPEVEEFQIDEELDPFRK